MRANTHHRRLPRVRLTALATMAISAVAALSAASLTGTGSAAAVAADQLRSNCSWQTAADKAARIQTCTVHSNSMGIDVTVQIRASDRPVGSAERGVYFLDGIGAPTSRNTWASTTSGALAAYGTGYNLVMPAGGAGTWMTDWQSPSSSADGASNARWETFLAKELPAYLASSFSVGTSGNAVVGLSMSGGPAVMLALDNPTVFSVAQSFSGFYQTDNPIGWSLIPLIQSFAVGITNGNTAMWGSPTGPGNTWSLHDVSKQIARLKTSGQTVIISVGRGFPTLDDIGSALASGNMNALAVGASIEAGSYLSTMLLQAQARLLGLPVVFVYNNGIHNWQQWIAAVKATAPTVKAALESAATKAAATKAAAPTTTALPSPALATSALARSALASSAPTASALSGPALSGPALSGSALSSSAPPAPVTLRDNTIDAPAVTSAGTGGGLATTSAPTSAPPASGSASVPAATAPQGAASESGSTGSSTSTGSSAPTGGTGAVTGSPASGSSGSTAGDSTATTSSGSGSGSAGVSAS